MQRPATPLDASSSARPARPYEPALHDSLHDTSHGSYASYAGLSVSGLSINGGSVAGGSVGGAPYVGADATGLDGPRLPPLPDIGLDEHVYANIARQAHENADREARDAAKVGLYVTLAVNRPMKWAEKLRHFRHALDKHCHASRNAATRIWKFYHALGHLVKQHCGQEALRIASAKDDVYAARLASGVSREEISASARKFFQELIGDGIDCPEHMLPDDFVMIRMIRDQWV